MIKKIFLMQTIPTFGRSTRLKEYGPDQLDEAFKEQKRMQVTDVEGPEKRYWVKIIYK